MVHALTGRRERNRLERHAAFLASAKAVVAAEGLDALTMQRLATELDCAVGTAYTYFPSKSALVAELQRDAVEAITRSYAGFLTRFDGEVAGGGATGKVVALAHLVGFGRFWIATFETHAEEAKLLQLLMAEPGRSVIDDVDVGRVLPAAGRLLDHARSAFERAADLGALRPGDAMERTVVLAATLNGLLLLDRLARVDPDLFDGRRLAAATTADLLRAWGAPAGPLADAVSRIDTLATAGPLAPRRP
jgi:AcrR family transcriptional regulator